MTAPHASQQSTRPVKAELLERLTPSAVLYKVSSLLPSNTWQHSNFTCCHTCLGNWIAGTGPPGRPLHPPKSAPSAPGSSPHTWSGAAGLLPHTCPAAGACSPHEDHQRTRHSSLLPSRDAAAAGDSIVILGYSRWRLQPSGRGVRQATWCNLVQCEAGQLSAR